MCGNHQQKIEIEGKIVYKVQFGKTWSIVIMPDNVLINSYQSNNVYIHPKPENPQEKMYINKSSLDEVYSILCNHLEYNKKLLLKKLIVELNR